jgi:hypothetical protein
MMRFDGGAVAGGLRGEPPRKIRHPGCDNKLRDYSASDPDLDTGFGKRAEL